MSAITKKITYAVISLQHSVTAGPEYLSGIAGLAGSRLYALPCKNIAVVTGDFSGQHSRISKDLLLDYARVIEDLFSQYTLLPFQFGNFWNSDESVLQMLGSAYESLIQNLQAVENKYEFSLRVLLDHSFIADSSDIESPDYADIFPRRSEHTDYLLRKIREYDKNQARSAYADKLFKEISGLMDIKEAFCKLKKENSKNILLDWVFLIEKSRMEDAVRIVDEISHTYSGLYFLMTGPWPPYSFTEVLSS